MHPLVLLRTLRNQTQAAFGKNLQIAGPTVSNLEHGASKPTMNTAKALARYLNCTLDDAAAILDGSATPAQVLALNEAAPVEAQGKLDHIARHLVYEPDGTCIRCNGLGHLSEGYQPDIVCPNCQGRGRRTLADACKPETKES